MKKRFAFILVLALLFGFTAPSVEAVYEENSGLKLSDWAVDSYQKANQYGILNWFHRNDDFTAPITRAEFCDMIFNVVKSMHNGIAAEIDVCAASPFTDTDRYSVYCLSQLGIAKGVGGELFDPNGTLTREQATTFMYRAGELLDFTYLPDKKAEFTDASAISPWASDAADVMQESGLMIGTDTGAFLPKSLLTREQAAAVLVRFLEKNGCNSGIYIKDEDSKLTLADLAGLNGKYRSIGEDSYEVSYYQNNFASLVVNVTGDTVQSAVFTYLNTGRSADLVSMRMDDFMRMDDMLSYSGRYYLGNNAYNVETGGKRMLEMANKTVLTLPADQYDSIIRYQKMNGAYVAYTDKGEATEFFTLGNGEKLFAVNGSVRCITNKYIITETTRYSGPTVDAAYSAYGVYTLDGTLVESLGLQQEELY